MNSPRKRTFIVVDDHESVLKGTIAILQTYYPDAELLEAQHGQHAQELVQSLRPDLVLSDLSIPLNFGTEAQLENGLNFLRWLMENYPTINILVQSAHVRTLVRLKSAIASHQGGFAVADKSLPLKDMMRRVDLVLDGGSFTPPEIRSGIEIKSEWLKVLTLAFQEGLQDKAIAIRMNVAERTVRHYWTKIQDVLEVYPAEKDATKEKDQIQEKDLKNIRIQTELRAREEGLID